MKKVLLILLVLICLLGLVGCDPGVNNLNKEVLLKNTVKIELYNYVNEDPKLLRSSSRKEPSFDFTKATLMATLDESRFEEIIEELSAYDYFIDGTVLNEPMGKTLVLFQNNGNMIVLFGCPYTNENNKIRYYGDCNVFDENGTFVENIGDVGHLFGDMIESKYFPNNP